MPNQSGALSPLFFNIFFPPRRREFDTHLHLVPRLRVSAAVIMLLLYAFMTWTGTASLPIFPLTLPLLFLFGVTAPSGPGPSHSQGFYITHNAAPQSVGLLWTCD